MKAKFKISPRILDHLGVAAYTSLQKCLADFVAIAMMLMLPMYGLVYPRNLRVNSQIIIRDDGIGMSPDDIRDRYLYIGFNRRTDGEISVLKKRPIIGNKGIGKLAGFGVAHTVEMVSVKDKVESRLMLYKEIFDNYTTLSECSLTIETQKTEKPNGTELILHQLSTQLKPIE